MIYDKLENLDRYRKLAPAAWDLIQNFIPTVPADAPKSKVPLDGTNVRADILRYNTNPLEECKVELHARYIDVQVFLEGEEDVYCTPTDGLEVITPMDSDRDAGFFKLDPARATRLAMKGGYFAIFFPGEGHLTGANPAGALIRKIVFKIDSALVRK